MKPRVAGSRCRTSSRSVARAERLRGGGVVEPPLGPHDRAHAARDERRADDREDAGQQREHLPRAAAPAAAPSAAPARRRSPAAPSRNRSRASAHRRARRRRSRRRRRAARRRSIAPSAAATARPSDVRAPKSSRLKTSRPKLSAPSSSSGAAASSDDRTRRPPENHASGTARRSILFVPLLELVHQPPAVDERRVPRAVVVARCATTVGGAFSRPAKCASSACGASDRRGDRRQQRDRDQRRGRRRASCALRAVVSLARGSTSASARSDTSVPTARNSAPAPAQPATR